MKILRQAVVVGLVVAATVYSCQRFSGGRLPRPDPSNPHDPLRLGYPDTPDKPIDVRRAEEIIAAEWDYLRSGITPEFLDMGWASWEEQRKKIRIYYRSPEEEAKARSWLVAQAYIHIAATRQCQKGALDRSEGNRIEEAFLEFVRADLRNRLGIREYYADNPADRAILEANGFKFEDTKSVQAEEPAD